MSVGQLTGTFASHNTKYDDGEANYKLPLFNYEGYSLTSTIEFYWTRCVEDDALVWCASPYYDDYNGYIGGRGAGGSFGIRPMIYIR